MEISFTLNGQLMRLSTEEIAEKMQGVPPEPPRSHLVEINGVWYPVKQAFAAVTGIDRADFISHRARSVFKRLGLPIKRVQG